MFRHLFRRFAIPCVAVLLVPLAVAAQSSGEIPVTTASDAARAAFVQGEAYLDVGRNDQAREAFRKAVELDPRFTYAWLKLAVAASSPGEFREAMRKATATAEGKSQGEKLLVAVNETYLSADADRRLELAKELVAAYPRSPRARLAHGFALQSLDRHDEARAEFSVAVKLEPNLYAAHAALGFSYLFNEPRDPATAVAHMEHGLELSPREAKAHEAAGDGYRALGDLPGARTAYSRALELDPELSVASLKKGHVNSFLAHFDEARRDYEAGVRGAVGANRVSFANYRAFVHLHAGRPDEAIRELRDVAREAAGSDLPADDRFGARVFTLTNAAAIALHHGRTDQAQSILEERARAVRSEAERLGDTDFMRRQEADIRLWNARLALSLGDIGGADRELDLHRELLASDRDPTRLQGYHLVKGLIALAEDRSHRAVRELRQADPEDQYAKFHLALALEGAGRRAESKRLFREVADFNFNSVDYALVRNEALKRKG